MNPRPYLAAAIAALLMAAPALAQDDETLKQEFARLTMQDESPALFEHYRGRPTAASYELEVQMKHQDKLAKQDKTARANAIREELVRRNIARERAKLERWQEQVYGLNAQHEDMKRSFDAFLQQGQAQVEAGYRQIEQTRQQSDAMAQQRRAQQREMTSQAEAFFERSRTSNQPPVNYGPTVPIEPMSGPSFPGAYFPPVQQAPARQQSPMEAYETGYRAGQDLGRMIRGLRDLGKRKRRDKIIERFGDGTITGDDYRQLVKDGYTDLAEQLMRLERGLD